MAGQLTHKRHAYTSGFTIVELLIVIVVIGILAAITIVAYNGVTKNASAAVAKENAATALRKLNTELISSDNYPSSLSSLGIQNGGGTTYQYSYDNTANPKTFCVTVITNGSAYFVTQDGTTSSGLCPGHSMSGIPAPAIGGYSDFTSSATMTNITMPTVPDGAWMIIVMAYTTNANATPPTGWTTLYSRITANTMQTMVFGKIKTSSDPSTFSIGNASSIGPASATGVIFWGTGASSDLNTWVKGTSANRNGTTAQQYITTTPTLTTTTDQSLVLSISTERTTATETDISSLTGATKWFFIAQPDSTKIQTITLSYAIQASAGTSTPVTVTYPNPQTTNGTALQIALPPS